MGLVLTATAHIPLGGFPVAPVESARSLPAKSTRLILLTWGERDVVIINQLSIKSVLVNQINQEPPDIIDSTQHLAILDILFLGFYSLTV